MKDLYILQNERPTKVPLAKFVSHCQEFLKERQITASDERVMSCLSVLRAEADPEVEGPDRDFYEAVKCLYEGSENLKAVVESKTKNTTKTEVQQKALNSALDDIELIKTEAELGIHGKIRQVIDRNFEILPCGAAVPREGVVMTAEDAYVAVGGALELRKAGDQAISASGLVLADIVGAIEDRFGSDFDYTQILKESGKSETYLRQSLMVYRHFPPRKRNELDVTGKKVTYSHYVKVCDRSLEPEVKDALIRFVERRSDADESVSSENLAKLVRKVRAVPKDMQSLFLSKLEESNVSTQEALVALDKEAAASQKEARGGKRWLYIYRDGDEVTLKTSNLFSDELAYDAVHTLRLTPEPSIRVGPETFDEIDFEHVSPEFLQGDPVSPEDIEVFADYHISADKNGSFLLVGTRDGKVDTFSVQNQDSLESCLEHLKSYWKLDDQMRDPKGKLYNLRYEL